MSITGRAEIIVGETFVRDETKQSFELTTERDVLFTQVVELKTADLPSWEPHITLNRRWIESDDAMRAKDLEGVLSAFDEVDREATKTQGRAIMRVTTLGELQKAVCELAAIYGPNTPLADTSPSSSGTGRFSVTPIWVNAHGDWRYDSPEMPGLGKPGETLAIEIAS